jgi:UDPglucose 6-dehydrogenase
MKLCVYGLGHLGTVTAACMAEHSTTVACDPNTGTMSQLSQGRPPFFEPGLAESLHRVVSAGSLSFSNDLKSAVQKADIVWVTFDTPVDDDDTADVEFIRDRLRAIFSHLSDGTVVLISSQVPVGFTASIEAVFRSDYPNRRVEFAYIPENLRLGKALDSFRHPGRIVAGVRDPSVQARIRCLLEPFCRRIEWMSIESAEMSKHALNAFLAMSVSFANELAALCERTGADAREVERGLKSDPRIGPSAYLRPGSAFAGGTLARDVQYLNHAAARSNLAMHLIAAVLRSNDEHKQWPRRKLREMLGDLSGKTVAVLGLAYKPGTDSLRRASAIELCLWIGEQGGRVNAADPIVRQMPTELQRYIHLCSTPREALTQADAAVVALEWPDLKVLTPGEFLTSMRAPIVLDPDRVLSTEVQISPEIRYVTVGKGCSL